MKQSISLVEVLISVMLISVVIVALLQIKENNLYFLEQNKSLSTKNDYISLVAFNDNESIDKDIYLDDVVDFKDDEIRKRLKSVKIKIKNENLIPLEFSSNEYKLFLNVKQTNLSINNDLNYNKYFYRFSIND